MQEKATKERPFLHAYRGSKHVYGAWLLAETFMIAARSNTFSWHFPSCAYVIQKTADGLFEVVNQNKNVSHDSFQSYKSKSALCPKYEYNATIVLHASFLLLTGNNYD